MLEGEEDLTTPSLLQKEVELPAICELRAQQDLYHSVTTFAQFPVTSALQSTRFFT